MSWTLRKKLFAMVAIALVSTAGLAATASWGFNAADTSFESIVTATTALRGSMDAQNSHTAVRGDVFAGLLAESPEDFQNAANSHAENSQILLQRLAELDQLPLAAGAAGKVKKAAPI